MQHVPTEADWRSEPWCLDAKSAYDHFFGKSLPEAISLFEENSLRYQEDLMFMPQACFAFYIDAYVNYLLSEYCHGDSDGASCFFGLIEIRHKEIKSFSPETLQGIRQVLRKLATHQEYYDADPSIYGDFQRKAERCLKQIS